ncbi:MAG: cell division transport system ATP-binding protein [Maribacter sp.]
MQKPIVEIKNCTIHQQDYVVLREVNLTIGMGEFIYLVGKTGSGKTSFLKSLYGALPLHSGEAKVVGEDLKKLNWKNYAKLRRKLGVVFQDFNLLADRTVDENLKFVMRATDWEDKKKMEQRADEVLTAVGLKGKGWKSPHQLSGGEQQRVVIARAFLNRPELILADEPTGNLDPETADDIVRLLRDLSKKEKVTVIFATHNYNILETYPGRVIRCQNGKLLDEQNYLV